MDLELEVVTIDNKEYYILTELQGKTETYLYLSNVKDEEDVFLRKTDKKDPDTIIPLESDEELEEATKLLKNFLNI